MRLRGRSEAAIQAELRERLRRDGWLVVKSHGNKFQPGWPDLYAHHPEHGARWIEVKRPKAGRLTKAQRVVFAEWSVYGVGIWVLTSAEEVGLLLEEPNWSEWL